MLKFFPFCQLLLYGVGHSHAVSPYNRHRVISPPVFVPVLRHNLVNIHRVALRPLIYKHAVVQVDAITVEAVNVNAVNADRWHRHVPRRSAACKQARKQSAEHQHLNAPIYNFLDFLHIIHRQNCIFIVLPY